MARARTRSPNPACMVALMPQRNESSKTKYSIFIADIITRGCAGHMVSGFFKKTLFSENLAFAVLPGAVTAFIAELETTTATVKLAWHIV